jgi:tetratricopeptide (TPR) repeat protein
MKHFSCLVFVLACSSSFSEYNTTFAKTPADVYFLSAKSQSRSSISGFVFGNVRQPIADAYVELLDEYDSTLTRTRTNGSGLYQFIGLAPGRYTVKVLPYGTDFQEQAQSVTIESLTIASSGSGRISSGVTNVQADFYLKLKANLYAGPFAAPEVVFVQEVPKEAKKLYEEGLVFLREKKEKEGFDNLKKAIEIYPDYHFALDRLGTEYVVKGYYEAAYFLLAKSLEINRNSYSSTFGLGVTLYHLKQNDRAVEMLERSTNLYKKSFDAYLWLGNALKRNGNFDKAETTYIKARELSKGKNAEVHWQLALLYNQQNRHKEAADSLELFLKYKPDVRDVEKIKQLIAQLRQKANGK